MAAELDYVPMPPSVVSMIQSAWKQRIKDPSGQSVY
jgi:phosphate transport system substrate-binding protein